MNAADLHRRYLHLREELEAAYAALRWDGAGIDRIADQLLALERTLTSTRAAADSSAHFSWGARL